MEIEINGFVPVNGTGTISLNDNTFRDVQVFGYFSFERWMFFVHQECLHENCFTVSEASTGCRIDDFYYTDIDYAVERAIKRLKEKRYYIETQVRNWRVYHKINLQLRNTINLQILAIDSLWI